MSERPDLSALRRDPAAAIPAPRRSLVSRVALPGVLLLAFGALALWAGRDALTPALDVRTVPVVVRAGAAGGGAAVARAAGWIEPDPFAHDVSALVEGVVAEVLVLEGDTVTAGQPVARLDDATARLALAAAERRLASADAARAAADAELKALAATADPQLRSEGEAASARASHATAAWKAALADRRAAEAARDEAVARRKRVEAERAAGSASSADVDQAVFAERAAAAAAEAATIRAAALDTAIAAARAAAQATKARVAAGALDGRSVAAAQAAADRVAADAELARIEVEQARLALDRHVVRAPVAGVVLSRNALPGSHTGAGDAHGGSLASLYDPARLQVRADVPLADAGKVGAGQKARVTVEALPGRTFDGQVTRIVPMADVAKNTVQAKVRIDAPDPALRPEMLARVEFLAAAGESAAAETRSVWVAARLLRRDGDRATCWIVADGRAALRDVRLGGGRDGDLVEVADGLLPGDDVIDADPAALSPGRKVREIEGGR